MTSTNGKQIGGFRREVEQERLGPTIAIAASVILGMRTARWTATHSDELSASQWDKEIEHSVRVAKTLVSQLTTRHPELFRGKDVPWFTATDDDVPK